MVSRSFLAGHSTLKIPKISCSKTVQAKIEKCPFLTPILLLIRYFRSNIQKPVLCMTEFIFIYTFDIVCEIKVVALNEGMIFILLRAFLEHWQNRDRTARKGSLAFCISLSVISLQKLTIVMFNLQFSSKKSLSVLLNRPCYITWSSRELEWRLI